MPRLVYALLCKDLLVDKESSSTSFIRTVEHASVRKLPTRLPTIYVGSLWELQDAKSPFSVALQLISPDGTSDTLGMQEVRPEATLLHKLNFQLPGLTVKQTGLHFVAVSLKDDDDWHQVATLPLYIAEQS